MNYNIVFSSLVALELQKSYDWYEDKQSGLGEQFLNMIEKSVSVISKYPEAFPIRRNSFREYVVPKFPYVVIYELIPDKNLIYVLHVFNTYLNPEKK